MRYVFAECVLDTRLYTLHRVGKAIRLRPKVFQVLRYLLEQRDHVVSKDELCAQVWPGQFISDATLEGCITLARRAIGDSGRAQQLIQSRRGYGYRFVGSVQEYAEGPSAQETAAAVRGPSAAPSGSRAWVACPHSFQDRQGAGRGCGCPRVGVVPASWFLPAGTPVQDVPEGERKLVTFLSCTLVSAVGGQASVDHEALSHQRHPLYSRSAGSPPVWWVHPASDGRSPPGGVWRSPGPGGPRPAGRPGGPRTAPASLSRRLLRAIQPLHPWRHASGCIRP